MSKSECYVTKVIGRKEQKYGSTEYALIEVEYESGGKKGSTSLMFPKKDEPVVAPGYMFVTDVKGH